jgi:hypothetical protein
MRILVLANGKPALVDVDGLIVGNGDWPMENQRGLLVDDDEVNIC